MKHCQQCQPTKGDTATAHNRAAGQGRQEEQEELLQLVARCVWLVNALCEDAGPLLAGCVGLVVVSNTFGGQQQQRDEIR